MRRAGWESLLAEYLAAGATTEFEWGERDCALWAGTWVLLCTGRDFLSPWTGRYRTARGSRAVMTRLGYPGVEAVADAALPARPVPLARRGDLVLHPHGALGVCAGLTGHFLTERDGLTALPTLACGRAWAVD